MDDIAKQIKKLDLKQNAIKILINSIYGAFGNKYFYFYNPDIAQSITLQGQDLIKFSIKAVNHYFLEKWHLDTELHDKLGISQYTIHKVTDEAATYTDTDSIYVQFDSALNAIEGLTLTRDEAVMMCVKIDEYRLAEYFDRCFERYGLQFNTNNRLKFKLENISEYGIWLKKKNYALKVAYEPNPAKELFPEHKRSLLIKGLESIKGSYPIWARNKLKELTAYILEIGKGLDIEGQLIPKLQAILDEAETLHIDELAFNFKVRVFDKYVENEAKLILKKGISIYPRAAAYYNYLLITNGLDTKYNKIKQGESIRFYHCAPNKHEFDVFSYSPKNYPEEIAPPMDLKRQFFSLIIEPINRFLSAMKITPLDENLKRQVEVIRVKTKKEITDDQMYPLYVLDKDTLSYTEVAEKFWKIIGVPNAECLDEDYPEYLETITKYGLNSLIIPKYELDKYIKRIVKKRESKTVDIEE
jgi:hypothetical protein